MVKASITRLEDRIQILEFKRELSHADRLAIQRLMKKLEEEDAEFKKHHYFIMELLEDKGDLEQE